MEKTEKLTRKALAAFMAAMLIASASACGSGETKSGDADGTAKTDVTTTEESTTTEDSTTEAPESQDDPETTAPDDIPDVTSAAEIDPKTADYSKVDITIPFGSGQQIVDFTNDMLEGKYDGKIVKCEGITSRRMYGNAMMQAQDDGTKRGFTWYIVDSTDPDDYPPEDAQAEITGIVGIGDYGVRYLYVLPENVVIRSGSEEEVNGTGYIPGEPGDPFYRQRDILKNEGAPVGVRYLGYIEYDANDPEIIDGYISNILDKTGTLSECDLEGSSSVGSFISTGDGTELYLIIPADPRMNVEVFKAELDEDTATLRKGESVYTGDGTPFLLKCNVSEIMPDVIINITDENGDSFEWSPSISGMDGTVVIKNEAGRNIKDFTDYDKLATADDVPRA